MEHSVISDPNIHEPKGASTATANTVYIASGTGSGSWAKIAVGQLDTTSTDARYALAAYLLRGAGSPEGLVTAPIGTIYLRTDGGAGTTLYIKESGTGTIGWIAK